jgi:hypothetical protein
MAELTDAQIDAAVQRGSAAWNQSLPGAAGWARDIARQGRGGTGKRRQGWTTPPRLPFVIHSWRWCVGGYTGGNFLIRRLAAVA